MNFPFKVKNAKERLAKSSAEVIEIFDRIIAEEDKKQLSVQCTSLEIENDKLRKELTKLKGENRELAAKNRELQQELNQKRFDFSILFIGAQQLSAENLRLRAQVQIKTKDKEVNSSGTDSSM